MLQFPCGLKSAKLGFCATRRQGQVLNSHFFRVRDSTSGTSPPIFTRVLVQPGGISPEATLCNKGGDECLEIFLHGYVWQMQPSLWFTSVFVAPVQPNVGKPSISLGEKCSETNLPLVFRLSCDTYIVAIAFSSSTLQRCV